MTFRRIAELADDDTAFEQAYAEYTLDCPMLMESLSSHQADTVKSLAKLCFNRGGALAQRQASDSEHVVLTVSSLTLFLVITILALLLATSANAQNFRAADQVYVVVAGHAVSGDKEFSTELHVTNLSRDPVNVSITYARANTFNADTERFPERLPVHIHLSPNEYREIPADKVAEMGISGFGMLVFDACFEGADCSYFTAWRFAYAAVHESPTRAISVEAIIRSNCAVVVNGQTKVGTCGDSYAGIPWFDAARQNERLVITGIRSTTQYRTNLTLANASEFSSTYIVATLFDGTTGMQRGQYTVHLGPLESMQMSAAAMFPALAANRLQRIPPVLNPWVRIEQSGIVATADAWRFGCANGCPPYLAQGSLIDNQSGDAMPLMPSIETGGPNGQSARSQNVQGQKAQALRLDKSQPANRRAVSLDTLARAVTFAWIGGQWWSVRGGELSLVPAAQIPVGVPPGDVAAMNAAMSERGR